MGKYSGGNLAAASRANRRAQGTRRNQNDYGGKSDGKSGGNFAAKHEVDAPLPNIRRLRHTHQLIHGAAGLPDFGDDSLDPLGRESKGLRDAGVDARSAGFPTRL